MQNDPVAPQVKTFNMNLSRKQNAEFAGPVAGVQNYAVLFILGRADTSPGSQLTVFLIVNVMKEARTGNSNKKPPNFVVITTYLQLRL